ncbi:MAG: glycoside hydrolase family 43 protein [Micromonosporaceae bacterium]
MNPTGVLKSRKRTLIATTAVAALTLGTVPAASAAVSGGERAAASDVAAAAALPPTKVTDFNHADPAVVQHDGTIYSYATDGSSDVRKIPVISANSPTGPYQRLGKSLDAIPWSDGGSVMGPHVWHRGGSTFHMYFTARPRGGGDRCIGVATSTTGPTGPFRPSDNPLACDPEHNGAIDPSFFTDPGTGRNYLLYKTNGPNGIRRIWLQGLGPEGLAKQGGRTLLGARSFNYENLQLIHQAGRYFLFTSRDLYQTPDYKTTVNWSTNVAGPYPMDRAQAIMTRYNTSVAGPGGAELIRLASGQWVAFFHGWRQDGGGCDPPRFLYVATIVWGAAGDDPHLAAPNPGDAHC